MLEAFTKAYENKMRSLVPDGCLLWVHYHDSEEVAAARAT